MGSGDFGFGCVITQDLLGLPGLDLDDEIKFRIGVPFFGGEVQWNRNKISSPFIDGETTTYRTRQMVTEPVQIDVYGDDLDEVMANANELIAAFVQDHFNIAVTVGTTLYQYQCEAADYTPIYDTARFAQPLGQVIFAVPRQPEPIVGGVTPVADFVSKAQVILGWAQDQSWAILTATRDSNDALTAATIQWPDGTPGAYTADTVSTLFPGHVDAWHATYGSPLINTYRQPAVTRDSAGGVTVRPPLVVS